MRLVIMSDTHGDLAATRRIMELSGTPDRVFHAGDVLGYTRGEDPLARYLASLPGFAAVHGNCDRPTGGQAEGLDLSQEILLERFDQKLFLIHHSHRYGVKELLARAKQMKADAVIFGHTHRKELFKTEGIVVLNPGSPSRPRDGVPSFALYQDGTFALLDLNRGTVLARKSFADPDDF